MFKLHKIKKHFMILTLTLLFFAVGCSWTNPIYKITIKDADFDTIATLLEAELSGANMRVFEPALDIQAGMKARGEDFPKYKVYQFCNLTIGKEIFKITRDFGAFIPCKIYIYQKGNDVVVGTFLASNAIRFLDMPKESEKIEIVEKSIKLIEDEILNIINSLKQ